MRMERSNQPLSFTEARSFTCVAMASRARPGAIPVKIASLAWQAPQWSPERANRDEIVKWRAEAEETENYTYAIALQNP